MKRNTFVIQLEKGKEETFRQVLGQNWNEITKILDEIRADSFSLWKLGEYVFGYCETPDALVFESFQERSRVLADRFAPCGKWLSRPGEGMRLMYHDYGVVRKNKELIRYRVFAAKLRGDLQDEYKRRHDGLIQARHGVKDPGPDSNFTIWNTGRLIFGYDEIDTTMEKNPTKESVEESVKWESHMLEIMDWITDDVDTLLHLPEPHARAIRLAHHELPYPLRSK